MNLGDVIGQLMQEGMTPQTKSRLEHSMGKGGLGGMGGGGGGLGDILGSLMGGGGSPGSAGGGGLGDLLGGIGKALSGDSGVGGLSRGQAGGIGAIAGALLGGGGSSVKGAVGGGAMALLGTLALSALKDWQAQAGQAQSGQGSAAAAPAVSEADMQQMTAPQTAELCLRGMIEAAKADGEISQDEVERIVGKLEEGGITAEEQRFVKAQFAKPLDVHGLAAAIPNREVGAQVYAAALMAISVDTAAERDFLDSLRRGAGLDSASVRRLHQMVGAPMPS